ncbi:hypothetical protein ACWOFR_08640 [Carnobacterium gallinarum]|uniref:hypothetical protein n=1 Tax=Carnobacterium gallinarum TaxID=2749 RepID=UPI000557D91B|nr:hypothetical protein [Carnobacterium gallinarum]
MIVSESAFVMNNLITYEVEMEKKNWEKGFAVLNRIILDKVAISNIAIDMALDYQNSTLKGGFLLMKDKYGTIAPNTGIVELFRFPNVEEFYLEPAVVESDDYLINAAISYGKYKELLVEK